MPCHRVGRCYCYGEKNVATALARCGRLYVRDEKITIYTEAVALVCALRPVPDCLSRSPPCHIHLYLESFILNGSRPKHTCGEVARIHNAFMDRPCPAPPFLCPPS